MMWFAAVAFLVVWSGAPATADDLYFYVPDEKITGEPVAWYPWHGANLRGIRYQALVPKSAFGGKVFWIQDLAFAPSESNLGIAASICQVRVAHCTRTSLNPAFEDNFESGLTVLYEGSFVWNPVPLQWSDIGSKPPTRTTRPFIYNGRDNVVIEVRFMPSYPYDRITVRCCGNNSIQVILNRYEGYGAVKSDGYTTYPSAPAKMRITGSDTLLIASATNPSVGTEVELGLSSPADGGLPYQVGSSLGRGPIPLGNRKIELSPDVLLAVSTSNVLPHIFSAYAGILNPQGRAAAKIQIPRATGLVGIDIFTSFVTIRASAPQSIQSISNVVLIRMGL
jgi:hypothetical protein